ncbi:NeuD/PglB/VioB family sugar acetyltransferase [Vibrio hepatarius]|uniref:NeuD/PglB/VioB family sugar acetyltransferase n=1 Tax=Vibrio hepatarius TaxID=171383 RepID=UPI001C0956B3|nr:NeuD/PglB/VioB family sugar acetyltransferase [Vibrio hepatarius]
MKELILVGGGGHCASCIDVIESQGTYRIVGILDNANKVGTSLSGYQILDTDDAIHVYVELGYHFLITVGQIHSSDTRERLYSKLTAFNAKLATVISPRAYIARTAKIGDGAIIMHDCLINARAVISENCIINTKSLVEHDANISAHCHISTGAVINGGARVEEGTFVGSNAVVVQGANTKKQDFVKAGSCYSACHKLIVPMKTAVLTTIFPLNEGYIQDFFNSLVAQTIQGFDIILINDGFGDLSSLRRQYNELNIIELEPAKNFAKNRERMCQYALDGHYDAAIFADIDDYFSDNRIEQSLQLLGDYDIVVNDMTTFCDSGVIATQILSSRILDGQEIPIDFIRDKNFFGLTNTAIRLTDVTKDSMCFSNDLVAVDWYLFSLLLYQSKRAVFTNKAITYYRQHQANTVGIGHMTLERLKQTLKVRETHYRHMLLISETYQVELNANNELVEQLKDSTDSASILGMNQTNSGTLLWWEVIAKKVKK